MVTIEGVEQASVGLGDTVRRQCIGIFDGADSTSAKWASS